MTKPNILILHASGTNRDDEAAYDAPDDRLSLERTMSKKATVEINQQGAISIPAALLEKYKLRAGDKVSLLETEDGLMLNLQEQTDVPTLREEKIGYGQLKKTIKLQSHVGTDGLLNLQIPVGVTDTQLDILIVIQAPSTQPVAETNDWPPDFFEQTAGAWQGEPLRREMQGQFEERADLF